MTTEDHPLKPKLASLPAEPGVYLMKDAKGRVIYVGKAARLASRVRSYFQAAGPLDPKTRSLVDRIVDFDYVVTPSEKDALLLESQLVKEYKPRYNIRLKDDKRFPYLRLTLSEPFPRLDIVRQPQDDGDEYYGPYTDSGAMRLTLKTLTKLFPVRTCHLDLPKETVPRPCLDYYIDRCGAPCVGYVDQQAYGEAVQGVRLFLQGKSSELLASLRSSMDELSGQLQFEHAARVRDQLRAVEKVIAKQQVLLGPDRDVDVLALEREGRDACGVVLRIRDGKLIHTETYMLASARDESTETFFDRFAAEIFGRGRASGKEVLLERPIDDQENWAVVLGERLERKVKLHAPQRGKGRALVDMARTNARFKLRERRARTTGTPAPKQDVPSILDLKERLDLTVAPHSIECFDMSHFQGSQRVGSLVYFQGGEPLKSRYRRFKIRQVDGIDDFAMMQEVLERYYGRMREEDKLPADLVVVDGGAGQLGVAVRTLQRYGFVETAVIGLAKREEEIYTPKASAPLRLPRSSSGLKLLQRVRDEAHRFAVTYHRKLRGQEATHSVLDDIPGIGAVKRRSLITRFGSADAVAAAAQEELLGVPGIGPSDAERIRSFFLARQQDQEET